MDKNAALEVLSRFKKGIECRGIRVDKLILFGSYATGAHRAESDIDVVVISKDFAGKDYWERIEILSDIIYEIFEPIEAVALTPEEWGKRELGMVECAKGGEIIYS